MESCIPFLLTKVRGIPSQYNTKNMAVGIKGMYNVGISRCALLSIDIIFNPFTPELPVTASINPFAPGDFAEKRVLKLVEWFSGHCRAIKS